MASYDIIQQISDLERAIAALPPGNIGIKKVKGNTYFYHRCTVNGKLHETYVDQDAVPELRASIEKRKALEAELKSLKKSLPASWKVSERPGLYDFRTIVRLGEQLKNWAMPAKDFKHRECYEELKQYVFGDESERVFILYGLRRTGKTTLIRQIVLDMSPDQLEKAAFIQVKTSDTLSAINKDLQYLEQKGYNCVFLDEVTLMQDFIEGAALFSDIYVSSGMKIVLSGTDSLGFVFTESEQLYDRCIMLHTTFIPYREFEYVLGKKGIDEYIRYGGTMSRGGVHYNEVSPFSTKESADEYIDTAIAKNIQHSLEYYRDGGHFRHLYELYQKGELTGAINRVVEDINHRFTKEVLTKTFRSDMLSSAARNLLHDRQKQFDLMENIDPDFVLESIRKILDILEKEEQTVEISDAHAIEIREYLLLLDLIMEVDQFQLPNVGEQEKKVIISQPGLRYAQVKALVNSLLQDEKFADLSLEDRNLVIKRVMETVEGRMMEDIVLLETAIARPDRQVFQLHFAVGEFDMVVQDPENSTCEIIEVKHSKNVVPQQYRYLTDPEKCEACSHRYGTISGRYVIYRGESTRSGNVTYLNVEEYLKSPDITARSNKSG